MREGWEYKKLNEVCDKGSSNIVISKLTDNHGEYPLFGASGLVKNIDFYHQDSPYIGIVKDGAGVGRVNIYPAYSSLVGTMQYIYPKEGHSLDYIKYFLVKLDLSHLVSGATIPHIYFKDYGKEIIPLPPKHVQLEIVSELDQINELIRLKKEQLKDYDNLAQSIFYEMFGDPVENESRESKNYKLIELCENKDDIKCGPFGTQLSKSEYVQSGVPVWGIPQINSHFQEPPTCFVSNLKADSLKDYSVKWGDIVMSRKGSVGLCCVFPKNMSSGILHSDVIRLRFDEKMVDSIFMMHYLHFSSFIRHQIKTISHGAIMAGLNVTKLKSLKVILPPLPLQQEFSSCISQIERLKAEVSNAIADLETLLASRMQYWFE